MKKMMTAFALAAAMALPALADSIYYFQSAGTDKYADGTTLLDGEFYALVWTKAGATFAGFNADGTLKDAANDRLLAAVPFAKGGKLARTSHQVTDQEAAGFVGGTFSVIALDTRNADGTLASTDRTKRTLDVVNNYSVTASMGYTAVLASTSLKISAPISVDKVSYVPEGAPQPVITDLQLREGANGRELVLKVKGTAAYLRYKAVKADIAGGSTESVDAQPENGAADAEDEIEIVVPAAGNEGFFKVTRQ